MAAMLGLSEAGAGGRLSFAGRAAGTAPGLYRSRPSSWFRTELEVFNPAPGIPQLQRAGGPAGPGSGGVGEGGGTAAGVTPSGTSGRRRKFPVLHRGGSARWRRPLAAPCGEVKGFRRLSHRWLFPWWWGRGRPVGAVGTVRAGVAGCPREGDGREGGREGVRPMRLPEAMCSFPSQRWPRIAGGSSPGSTSAWPPPLPR